MTERNHRRAPLNTGSSRLRNGISPDLLNLLAQTDSLRGQKGMIVPTLSQSQRSLESRSLRIAEAFPRIVAVPCPARILVVVQSDLLLIGQKLGYFCDRSF